MPLFILVMKAVVNLLAPEIVKPRPDGWMLE